MVGVVDPGFVGWGGCGWGFVESGWGGVEGGGEGGVAGGDHGIGFVVVDGGWGE